MVRVVGYVRLSQEDSHKNNTSIDNQIKMIGEYSKRNSYKLLKIFNDGFITGSSENRPEFEKMIELAHDKVFDIIIVRDLERFSRNQSYMIEKIKILRSLKIQVFDISRGMELTQDITFTGIMSAIAESVIEKGKKFQKDMMTDKIKNGKPFGFPPYGYFIKKKVIKENRKDKVTNMWVVERTKSKLIRKAFSYYNSGSKISIKETAEYTGMNFNTLLTSLRNKKYIGIFEYTRIEKIGQGKTKKYRGQFKLKDWTPLIELNLFNQVQNKLDKKATNENRIYYTYEEEDGISN